MNSFIKKFVIGEWNLGVCNQDFFAEFRNVKKGDVLTLKATWMRHKRTGSFFADTVDKDMAEIIAEGLILLRSKGHISRGTIDRKTGKMMDRKVVIEETCPLLYPFYDAETGRFEPESCRNGNWATYKFDGEAFSDKRIITREPLIGCTPIEWNERWYLFAVKQARALDQLLYSQLLKCFIVIDSYREVFRQFFSIYIAKIVPILHNLHLQK